MFNSMIWSFNMVMHCAQSLGHVDFTIDMIDGCIHLQSVTPIARLGL